MNKFLKMLALAGFLRDQKVSEFVEGIYTFITMCSTLQTDDTETVGEGVLKGMG